MYFPKWYSADIQYAQKFKELLLARLDVVMNGESKEYDRLVSWFIRQQKPREYSPFVEGNQLVESEKSAEKMTAALQESGLYSADMTEYEYYSRALYLEEKATKLKNAGK